MKPLRLLFVLIPIGVFICIMTQMIVANEMIVKSDTLRKTERRIAELEEQNTYLSQQVVKLSSITRVSEAAKNMGFIDAKQVIAFTDESFPVAIRR